MAQSGQSGAIVSILCDSGERYASTCFNEGWLAAQGIDTAPDEAQIADFLKTGHYC
jgi:cysteine synthase A